MAEGGEDISLRAPEALVDEADVASTSAPCTPTIKIADADKWKKAFNRYACLVWTYGLVFLVFGILV